MHSFSKAFTGKKTSCKTVKIYILINYNTCDKLKTRDVIRHLKVIRTDIRNRIGNHIDRQYIIQCRIKIAHGGREMKCKQMMNIK